MTTPETVPTRLDRFRLRVSSNPVMLKELRGRMRGRRAFVVLTLYLLLLSGLSILIYGSIAAANSFSAGPGPDPSTMGKTLFAGVVAVELFLVCFVTPAFTAAGISGERERQTYDLLRTTLLPARAFVFGKLLSALSYVLLLIFAALPLQSLAFLLGGIGPEEVAVSIVLLVVSALAFSCMGIFFSSTTRTTLASTVLTYAALLSVVVGLPLVALLGVSIVSAVIAPILSASSDPLGIQVALYYVGWFLISINPAATAIATEIILMDQHSLLGFTTSVGSYPSPHSIWLISPWIPYTLIYAVLSVVMFLIAVRKVRQIDR